MKTEPDILKELEELGSSLARFPRTLPFSVPEGYFTGFPGFLTTFLEGSSGEDPKLTWPRTLPFAIPDHYFEQLPQQLLARAKNEGLPATSEMPFALPSGYFKELPGQILHSVKQQEAVPPPKRILSFPAWRPARWAAAALLVLGIGFGSLHFWKGNPAQGDYTSQLSSIQTDVLSEYLQQDPDLDASAEIQVAGNLKTPQGLDQLDDDAIIEYLNESGWDPKTLN